MIKSKNPFDGSVVGTYEYFTTGKIESVLENAQKAFKRSINSEFGNDISLRISKFKKLAEILEIGKLEYAKMITLEMGKPISQSIAEIEKCAWLCNYYGENAEKFLSIEYIKTDASESFVRHDPIGVVLAIMPWNYPFWQLFRFAVPAILAGNVVILKHSSNVSGCALRIEDIFTSAAFPKNTFQTILATSSQIETVIENPIIKGVTLTGSEKAGRSVAAIAGKNIKKTVLELGGSNASVIFEDADLEECIDTLVWSRFQNAGQSCIAGKRFIVLEGIYDRFISMFEKKVGDLRIKDPLKSETKISSMASVKLAEELEDQVQKSIEMGAILKMGGDRNEAKFQPTILENVLPGMPAFDEELFGPVASIIKAKDEKEAIDLVNNSGFGLGASLYTNNIAKAKKWIPYINEGAVFVNELVKSDPRLPFGGTKNSGYGRELSRDGILEFVNRKTVYIK